ncbi:cellulose synthase operon protein YhjQ [Pseudomonas sp. SORGH_AS199]|nr:cellulose synthase operon protein YhjQ [Pseudomonas sp. SORGH_AS_0199]
MAFSHNFDVKHLPRPFTFSESAMVRSLDIANLFRSFGGDPQRYHEFETAEPALHEATPPAASQPQPQPQPQPQIVPSAQGEPVITMAEAASQAEPGALPPLSRELAQLHSSRQASQAVVALDQALSRALPPLANPVLALMSARGGTGKTVIAAGLAQTLSRSGQPVLLVELDSQNVLSSLLLQEASSTTGSIRAPLSVCLAVDDRLRLVPFGAPDELDLQALEQALATDTQWLTRRLQALDVPADTLVILDCPTGSTPLSRQAMALATRILGVTTADATGYASLPRLERQWQRCSGQVTPLHLLNRVDPARPLSQDIAAIVAHSWGERLLGVLPESPDLEQALALGQGLASVQDAWARGLAELGEELLGDRRSPALHAARA